MKINVTQIKRLSIQYKRVKQEAARFMMAGDLRNYLRSLIKAAHIESAMLHA